MSVSRRLTRSFGTPRDAVDYIIDSFPIVRRKDEEAHGTYYTKQIILQIYDAMQESMRTGQPYQTRLDPFPGPPVSALQQWRSSAATTRPAMKAMGQLSQW